LISLAIYVVTIAFFRLYYKLCFRNDGPTKKDPKQIYFEKQVKKQDLEITKLQLEIKLLQEEAAKKNLVPEMEMEFPPNMFKRMRGMAGMGGMGMPSQTPFGPGRKFPFMDV